MKYVFLIFFFTASAPVFGSIELDDVISCRVTQSSEEGIEIGDVTKSDFTIRSLIGSTGLIRLKNSGSIFFYNQLNLYHLYGPESGELILATDFNRPAEFQGTIRILQLEQRDEVDLKLTIFHSSRIYADGSGEQKLVLGNLPTLEISSPLRSHILRCSKVGSNVQTSDCQTSRWGLCTGSNVGDFCEWFGPGGTSKPGECVEMAPKTCACAPR